MNPEKLTALYLQLRQDFLVEQQIIQYQRLRKYQFDDYKIISLYKKEISGAQIARQLKLPRQSVIYLLKKYQVPIKYNPKRLLFTEKDISKMVSLYENGQSSNKIGNRFKVSGSHVLRIIRPYTKIRPSGHPKSLPYGLTNKNLEDIKKRYEQGYGSVEIAKLYNVSFNAILYRLRSMGVQIRDASQSKKIKVNLGQPLLISRNKRSEACLVHLAV